MNIGYAAPTEDALEGQSRKIGSAAPAPASVTPPLPPTQEEEVSEEAQKGDTGELHSAMDYALLSTRCMCCDMRVISFIPRGDVCTPRPGAAAADAEPEPERTPEKRNSIKFHRPSIIKVFLRRLAWRHRRLHNYIIMLQLHTSRYFSKKRTKKMPSKTSEHNFE